MKRLKRGITKAIHNLGYDIAPISRPSENELKTLKNYSIRTIIDIGANRGQFAKRLLQIFPKSKLYGFEPLEGPYLELEKWAPTLPQKTRLFKVALGEKERKVEIFLHSEHDDSSSLLETTDLSTRLYPKTKQQKKVVVQQTTLDRALQNITLQPEILIKMDVQGYEDRVILGGKKTLTQAKICIAEVCLDQLYKHQASFKNVFDLMDGLGFKYAGNLDQVHAPDGHIIYIDALFIKNGG